MKKNPLLESTQIMKELKELESLLNESDRRFIVNDCQHSVLHYVKNFPVREHEFLEALFLERLSFMKDKIPFMKKSLVFKVSLQNQEDDIYRMLEIPYDINLADMIYIILASFHAYNKKEFIVKLNQKKYGSDTCLKKHINEYASTVSIQDINLSINDHFEVLYDLKEKYVFDIHIQDIIEHDSIQHIKNTIIKTGKGYGIWEGAHQLLDVYYNNYQDFLGCIQELKLDDLDFHTEEFEKPTGSLFNEEYRLAYEMR